MPDRAPLTGREYAALESLFAAISHFQTLNPMLEKRSRQVPGLWRDMRMVDTKTRQILDGILSTVPENKLRHVLADCKNARLYIKIEPPGSVNTVTMGFSYVPTKTLNELLCYVCEHECLMCNKTAVEARKCPVRKMLDNALPHDIQARDGEHCKYSDFTLGLEG